MKKFEEMTDKELIDFCHENMLGVEVCKALGCEEWCKEQDCPMFQCLNRFENYIKDHPTEKGETERQIQTAKTMIEKMVSCYDKTEKCGE